MGVQEKRSGTAHINHVLEQYLAGKIQDRIAPQLL